MENTYQLINLLKKSSLRFYQILALTTLALLPLFASAQVEMTMVGNPTYRQDFSVLNQVNTYNWRNNEDINNPAGFTVGLKGWYVQRGASPATTITAGNGSASNPGLYSLGSSDFGFNAADRSLGGVSSSEGDNLVYVLRLRNTTGQTVNTINVTFDLVQYFNNPGSSERFAVSYKTSDIASTISNNQLHTNTGWTLVDNRIAVPSKGRPGPKPADRKTVTLDLAGFSLAVGEEILIRFEDAVNTKRFGYNAIGIDNVAITANPNTAAFGVYHFVGRSSGNPADRSNLILLSNWNTNKDGSGIPPRSFNAPFQLFYIDVAENGTGNNRPETQSPTLENNQTWTVSGQGSKVILGDGTQDFRLTIAQSATFNGIIDLKSNSTFNINNNNNFDRNLVGTPAINFDIIESNTTVNYRGIGEQYISEADYFNLNVSGQPVKFLYGSSSATNALNLDAATIYLNDFDFTLGDSNVTPGQLTRTSGYFVTTGTGSLQRFIPTGSSALFPVAVPTNNGISGGPFYLPATVTQNGTEADLISVRALDGYYANYTSDFRPDGDRITQEVVNRSWVVEEAVPGGSSIDLTVQWNSTTDQTTFFNFDISLLNYFTGAEWVDIFKSDRQMTDNTRQMTGRDLVNLGVFSVGNGNRGNAVLPVELLSFKATRVNGLVDLKWSTATEKDNEYFTVENSADGYTFSELGRVKGAGNSTRKLDYSYLHKNAPNRLTYYRLKQTDFDGTVSYSKIVAVEGLAGATALRVYPNPGSGRYTLAGVDALVDATVVDATGRTVKKLNSLENDFTFDLTDQKAGIYFLRLTSGNEVKTLRLIKQK